MNAGETAHANLLPFTCSPALLLNCEGILNRRTGEQENAGESTSQAPVSFCSPAHLLNCSPALILPSAKMEAGGIEPPSRDNPNGGLYMLSRSFNLDAGDGDRQSSPESSRLYLACRPTAESRQASPLFCGHACRGHHAVPRLPLIRQPYEPGRLEADSACNIVVGSYVLLDV